MITKINQALLPLENLIKKQRKYIGYFLLFLTLLSFTLLGSIQGVKSSGEKAILLLWIILWLPIFARVCNLGIAKALIPLRKELGILMGTLAVVHAIAFIEPNQEFFLSKEFWLTSAGYPTAYAWGYAAYLMTLPLLFTSSNWAIRKLGKKWKTLHKLVYIIVIFVVVHVVLIKAFRGFEITPVIILILYFVAKTLEWRGVKFGRDVKISSENI